MEGGDRGRCREGDFMRKACFDGRSTEERADEYVYN